MDKCEVCAEMGCNDCKHCSLANPCIGCSDYDEDREVCKSNGGCGRE